MYLPPNWGTFFALIASFLVFWLVFKRLFFDPFLRVLGERERRIKWLNDGAERLIKEGREAEQERRRQLAAMRHDALTRREAERRRAEEQAARILEEARQQARASIDRVRAEIEQQVSAAENQLDAFARTLAGELAERVLGRRLKNGAAPTPRSN